MAQKEKQIRKKEKILFESSGPLKWWNIKAEESIFSMILRNESELIACICWSEYQGNTKLMKIKILIAISAKHNVLIFNMTEDPRKR